MANWSNKAVVLPAIPFDGDKVVFTAKRLLVEDMQVMAKFWDRASGKLVFKDPLDVSKTAAELVPKYIVGISGLIDSDGVTVSLESFKESASEFYFVPLMGALFAELMSISTAKGHEKNSAPPSPESSAALGGQNQ